MNILLAYLYNSIGIVVAITAHEYIKALTSTVQGDTLPKKNGKLTLNPFRHLDPLGFIFALLYGYGWSNPTQTSSTYYKDRKKGTLITYILPSVFNLFLSVVFALAYKSLSFAIFSYNAVTVNIFAIDSLYSIAIIMQILYFCAVANFTFALINIIPVHPFDGSKVLSVYLSPNASLKMSYYEKYLQIFFLILIFFNVIQGVLNPIQNLFITFLLK